ncbi:MAG: single-stranded DNA-binding protein [Bacteroidales bacterium]|nr:single-stranded DNA-binding protein [Bacteroidales bacterium]
MSINKAILVGNVGKDPEVRYLDSGVAVATITLATTERGYTLQNGTQIPDRTEWHNIVAWRGLAEVAEKYIKKGTQLYVEGKITTRKWEKDGVTRYTTEIVAENIELLGRRPESGHSEGTSVQPQSPKANADSDAPESGNGTSDLPF